MESVGEWTTEPMLVEAGGDMEEVEDEEQDEEEEEPGEDFSNEPIVWLLF